MLKHPVSLITTWLIIAILAFFAIGVYQVNRQAQQITQLFDDQTPLVFSFVNTARTMTVLVICEKPREAAQYVCKTEQYDLNGNLIPAPQPTPVPPIRQGD